jgi:GTP-binding protein EngB required for normal cell division
LGLDEPGNHILKDVLSDMLNIQTVNDLRQKLDYFWKIIASEHLEFDTILSLKEEILLSLSQLSSVDDLLGRQDLANKFHTLIQLIQPLNILYMTSLIENFEYAKSVMENKDIILFLGNTGAGKSTTIHFLAGSKMKKVRQKGFYHIEPIDSAPCAREINVAASTQSVTKSMTVVELPNGMIICDTPGFGDTTGPETDIANGIGLVNSLSVTRSVKPVMILSEKNMDRLRGVREMKNTMTSMFVDIPSLLPSMSYFFTKYDAEDADLIWEQLETLRNEFSDEDKFDINYVAIVDDMIKKTNPLAIIIDPMQKSEGSLSAEKILERVNALEQSGGNPTEILKTFVSPESENKLSDHWRVLQKQTNLALRSGDIEFLSKPFFEMKMLSKLRIEMHQPIYEDSVKQLETYALNQYNHAKDIFPLFFHRYEEQYLSRSLQIFKRLLILHPLLLDLSSDYDFSTLIHNLILDSLDGSIKTQDYFSDSIDSRLKLLLQVSDGVKREFYVLDEESNLQPHQLFQNSSISLEFMNQVRSYYDSACSTFEDEILRLLQRTKQLIDSLSPPNLFVENVRKIDNATHILSIHLPVESISDETNGVLSYFLTHLRETAERTAASLYPDHNSNSSQYVSIVAHFCSFLSSVQNTPDIDDYIDEGLTKIKVIDSHLSSMASQQFSKIRDDCQRQIDRERPDYDFVAYFCRYLNEIIENVPMLVEFSNRELKTITDLLNQDQLKRTAAFSRQIMKLLNYDCASREALVSSLKSCLLSLLDAQTTFSQLSGFFESKRLVEGTINERLAALDAISSDGSNEIDLHQVGVLISNLRFTQDLDELVSSLPVEFPQPGHLRDKTINHINMIFALMFENISTVSLSQYRGMSNLVDALNQFRFLAPGDAYQALDLIIDQMKKFGETMLVSKEESLEVSFSFIASCWNPDGPMTPLPHDSFPEHFSLFVRILSDFHEFLQQSIKLPPGLSHDLLFVGPDRLYQKWIAGPDSKIKQHIHEISNYLQQFSILENEIQFDSTHLIYQLSLLTYDMIALDKYVTSAKNYFSLNKISVNLMRKCSSDLQASVHGNLVSNNFQQVRDSLSQVRSNPLEEIQKLFPVLKDALRDQARMKCQQLQTLIRQIPRAQNKEAQYSHFKEILIFGRQLKCFLDTLAEFLDPAVSTMLTSSLDLIQISIEDVLTKRINGTKSSIFVDRYSECVQQLKNLSVLLDTIASESEYLHLSLQKYINQKDEIQQQLHEKMAAEVSKYSTLHPHEYPRYPSLSTLVSQLLQTQGKDSESLLLTLTDNVLNKLKDILSNVKNNP